MTNSGEFVTHVPSKFYLFIHYSTMSPIGVTYAKPIVGGMYKVDARLVDADGLEKLMAQAEAHAALHEGCADDKATMSQRVAGREEMQDITSDPKKKGNKEAVADSEKGLSEEMSHDARELATYADNHAQLHRSSHQPIIKNLQRKHDKGTYDHGKAEKLWGYHAKRAADSYHKEHGHKFSVAHRKEAAKHMADSARDEHGFGSVKEEQINEKAPPGAKFERMVKHIKKGYSKDGLTAKERGIAYATAWKAKKKEQMDESMGDVKKSYGMRKMKRKVSTVVKQGLGVQKGKDKTILVTNKGDPKAAAGGGVHRIMRDKYDPKKHNMASE